MTNFESTKATIDPNEFRQDLWLDAVRKREKLEEAIRLVESLEKASRQAMQEYIDFCKQYGFTVD